MRQPLKLIVLDRDGVINADQDDFIKSPDEWIPIPGSVAAIARLNAAGWQVAIATNQSGVGRGIFSAADLDAIHAKMHATLAAENAHIDWVTVCPHTPTAGCDCRKPLPGLFRQIADHYGLVNLTGVPIVGDALRDLDAGVLLGCDPYLVRTGKGSQTLEKGNLPPNTQVFENLAQIVDHLLSA